MNHSGDFSKDDMDLLATAQRESLEADAAALAEATVAEAKEATATTEPTSPAAPEATPAAPVAPASAPAPAAAAETPPKQGDIRAALRASRHAEQRQREENARLKAELLAAKATQPTQEIPPLDDATREDLEQYAPPAAKRMQALEAENAALKAQVKKVAPEPEWEPELLDPDVQDLVDELAATGVAPELSTWHLDPTQGDNWRAVKAADQFLRNTKEWAGKPMADRFAAAVAEVKRRNAIATTPTPKTLADAKSVIAATPSQPAAVTVGDLRGGTTPTNPLPDYRKMTDEEVMASLGP